MSEAKDVKVDTHEYESHLTLSEDGPRWAAVASGILHPFTLPPIAFLLLYLAETDPATTTASAVVLGLSVAIIFASALPLSAVVYLARRGIIDTIDVTDRTKRLVPLLLVIVSYAVGFALLERIGAPDLVRGLMLAYGVNTLVVAAITLWWKISIHAVGVAGPLVAVTFALGWWVLPAFLLVAVIGVARVALQRHTPAQVLAGGLLGTVLTAAQLLLFAPVS
jgi:membrane-associated phospholipid phosphatase